MAFLQPALVACLLFVPAAVAYSPHGALAAVDAAGSMLDLSGDKVASAPKRKLVRASAVLAQTEHASVAVEASGVGAPLDATNKQAPDEAASRRLSASLDTAVAAPQVSLSNSSADSCIAKCAQRRSECRTAVNVEGFKFRSCMAPCHAAKHECSKACAGNAACQAACSGPYTQCRASCKESLQLSEDCHREAWRSCRRVCTGDSLETTRRCKHSCATRGDSCALTSGVGAFDRSGCSTTCAEERKQCRAACSSDACRANCAVISKSCAYVCKMKVDATKTCRSKVSHCVSSSCQPKLQQAVACKREREQCCEAAGVAGCKLDVCWSKCKTDKLQCQTACEGDKACRRQCRDAVKECRGTCHTGRMAKRGCWTAWSSCLGVSAPHAAHPAGLLAEGAAHHEMEEPDDAAHGAAEEAEDMHEDEEWMALEEMELGDGTEVEADLLEETDDAGAERTDEEDAAEAGDVVEASGASAELALLNATNVKTIVGCPTGNGMQTVGSKWVEAEPEKCYSVTSGGPQETAGVRCCRDGAEALPTKKYGACKDLVAVTYEQAVRTCSAKGLHLCSLDELWAGKTCKTGCGMDRARVWTATSC